jgi:two-component system chemotaxis sensor kinase CheA
VNALHEQFVIEARELIHQATDDLIAMERDGFAPERMDRVFRAFHTLKGSAGVVALPAMTLALHAAEDLLAAIHAGRLPASAAAVDQALDCLDKVSGWVDDFEASASLPSNAGDDARRVAERLRALLSTPASKGTASAVGDAAEAASALPEWAQALIRAEGAAIARDRLPHRPCAVLRATGGLFLRRRRSDAVDAADPKFARRAHRSARAVATAGRPRSVLLQPSPVGHLRRGWRGDFKHFPLGAGSGANC